MARAWPDVSFGYGQRIVRFHYAGDRSPSVPNVLAVRRQVFEHPEADLREMATFLKGTLAQARRGDLSPCGGDELLGALIVYNAGHLPAPDCLRGGRSVRATSPTTAAPWNGRGSSSPPDLR